jgi:hypothetical protein
MELISIIPAPNCFLCWPHAPGVNQSQLYTQQLENDYWVNLRTQWTHYKPGPKQNSIYHLPPVASPTLMGKGYGDTLGLQYECHHRLCIQKTLICLGPFPQCTLPKWMVIGLFGKELVNSPSHILAIVLRIFLLGPSHLFSHGISNLKTGSSLDSRKESDFSWDIALTYSHL